MTRIFFLILFWISTYETAGQCKLHRSSFQQTPIFNEEFSYKSVNDRQFRERWDADFYTAISGNGTEYSPSSQLEMLPGGFVKLRATRLTPEQRKAATAAAASHNVTRPDPVWNSGAPIAYASCKLISKVAGDPRSPALPAHGYEGFTYGLFEIRCRLPNSGKGVIPAFWLHSPRTEIDIIDNGNDIPHRLLQLGVLDWQKRTDSCGGNNAVLTCWTSGTRAYKEGKDLSRKFNTYGAVWTPQEVIFYFNDRQILSVPAVAVMTHNETARIILNMATQGADSFASAEMIVDYVKVWKFKNPSAQALYRGAHKHRARCKPPLRLVPE